MEMKKLLLILTAGVVINLNAGLVSAIVGPDTSSDNYENHNRGIITSKDIDGDGIIDTKDDCLESDPCKEINGKGCNEVKLMAAVILDSDKDGVLDNIDKCPNTPLGYEVNELGCIKLVNLDVQFDTAKWDIKDNYTQELDAFLAFMKKHEKYNAIIEGHTDSDGSLKNNQVLSENRANAVKVYLINNGIEKTRLESTGYGETQALNNNKTKEEKRENRRVIANLKMK